MSESASRHPEVLQLPSGFVNNPEEFNIELPEYMSAEESEKMFVDAIKNSVQEKFYKRIVFNFRIIWKPCSKYRI